MRPGPQMRNDWPVGAVESVLLTEVRVLQSQVAALQQALQGDRARGAADPALTPPSVRSARTLYATCFGRFRVFRDDSEVFLGGGRLIADVFGLLVGMGRALTRDEVLELLWPEANPARSAHRLHVAVSQLRQTLDPPRANQSIVRFENDAYQLVPEALTTDFQVFDAYCDLGWSLFDREITDRAADAFRTALAVYAGDFLSERPYAEWALQRRAHFAERRLGVVSVLADLSLHQRDLSTAMDYAQVQLAADSLRERAHRQLMRAHYLLGQRACAVRQYDCCVELLKREMGVRPSLLTRELRDAIVSDSPLPDEPAGRGVHSATTRAPEAE